MPTSCYCFTTTTQAKPPPPPRRPLMSHHRPNTTTTPTHPSAPAMHAPSHPNSVSSGKQTPCTSARARGAWYGGKKSGVRAVSALSSVAGCPAFPLPSQSLADGKGRPGRTLHERRKDVLQNGRAFGEVDPHRNASHRVRFWHSAIGGRAARRGRLSARG